MVPAAQSPLHSSRRALAASTRRLAQAMGLDLDGHRPPGLFGSVLIIAVIAVFGAGLLWGAIDQAMGSLVSSVLR